jgi:MFS transporter, DHA2 family, glioxin efflux transporter
MQSAAQAALANRLLHRLPDSAPGVETAEVLTTGADDLISFGSNVHGIRVAYMDGLTASFALACVSMGLAFVLSLFSPWRRISVPQ